MEDVFEGVGSLLDKLASRSWFWLFRQSDLKLALGAKPYFSDLRATRTGPEEVEVQAEPTARSGLVAGEVTVTLRRGSSGGLMVATACRTCFRPHCPHAALLLLHLGSVEGRRALKRALRMASPVETSEAEPRMAAPRPKIELERVVRPVVRQGVPMIPVLTLSRVAAREVRLDKKKLQVDTVQRRVGVARLQVAYEGVPEALDPKPGWTPVHHRYREADGRECELVRRTFEERSIITSLTSRYLGPLREMLPQMELGPLEGSYFTVPPDNQALYWASFLTRDVPDLRRQGWMVKVADDFGFSVLEPEETSWFTDLAEELEGEGRNWFRLDLGFQIDGQRLSLVPVLSRALDEGLTVEMLRDAGDQSFLLAIDAPGDPVVSLPARRLLPLMEFLVELMSFRPAKSAAGTGVRLDRLRAAQLTELDGLQIRAPEALRKLRERLEGFEKMSAIAPPRGLQAELRPYQLDGVTWLQFLREFDLHGVLADDMGLGKTLQTIAHLLLEKEAGRSDRPSLVVAPTSVLRNWQREMERFAPDLKVLVLHGPQRRKLFPKIPAHDVVITSFPLVVRDEEKLVAQPWHVAVLDEAQNIKNARSLSAQVVGRLEARHRLCLSGTPMENHLGELWSLFQFLMPGFLGDTETFRSVYRTPIEKRQEQEPQRLLARRVRPLMLRRTKDAVAKDLPPKTEILHRIDLEGPQADLYETIRAAMDARVREAIASKGLERSQIVVLDALLKLRQVCCHPALLKQEAARAVKKSAKTAFFMDELLVDLVEEGRQVLVFSQFTEMLAILEKQLVEKKIAFVKLTGQTKDREQPVRSFQAGEVPVFLISLKAGGSGLNLTAADTVVHYDPWWNPAAEAQASDRAHRIGQTRPVFVHKLICAGTIEEKIVELQRQKAAMLEGLLGGRTDKLRLTPEDVRGLLEPLA